MEKIMNHNSKPSTVSATDPFLTEDACKEYCSLFSSREDGLPSYLSHYKDFLDNVTDISSSVLDNINATHRELEMKHKEAEKKEEERLSQQKEVEQKLKQQRDRGLSSFMNQCNKYVKRSCPVKIPFKSTLNHKEHEFYLMAFLKFRNQPPRTSLEKEEYEQYLSMQNRVFNEQSCLMNFSYKVAQLILKEYNDIPSFIQEHIESYVSHKSERYSAYPELYKTEVDIPLKPQLPKEAVPPNFLFTHLGHLLSVGLVPGFFVPHRGFQVRLADESSLTKVKSPVSDRDFDGVTRLYKCPVSRDPNAEYLAVKHNVNIVISAGAFKTLADNQEQPFDKEWYLPTRIKTCTKQGGSAKDASARIIFIDKSLPKKSWLPLQKKQTFYKASALGQLTKPIHKRLFRMSNPVRTQLTDMDTPSYFDSSAEDNIDTFGSGDPSDFSPREKNKPNSFPSFDLVENDLHLTDDDESDGSSKNSWSGDYFKSNVRIDSSNSSNSSKGGSISLSPLKETPIQSSSLLRDTPFSSSSAGATPVQSSDSSKGVFSSSSLDAAHVSTTVLHSLEGASVSSTHHSVLSGSHNSSSVNDREQGFLDDLLDKQDSFLKPKLSGEVEEKFISSTSTFSKRRKAIPIVRNNLPWSNTRSTDWGDFKVKPCSEGVGINYHYQLFVLEATNNGPAKEDQREPVKILVRHRVHGLSNSYDINKFKKKPQKRIEPKAFVLFPKIENQLFFGCEVNSFSEIVQQWASLVVRPNTSLLQVRVCSSSGAVALVEDKSLEAILKEGNQAHINFRPQSVLFSLEVLFSTLMRMASGCYILHHSPKTEAFVKLFKAVDSNCGMHQGTLNLRDIFENGSHVTRTYAAAPWLAIDTHVLTPFHLKHRKIPATFPMDYGRKLTKEQRSKIRQKVKKKIALDNPA